MIPDTFYDIRYWQSILPILGGVRRIACQQILHKLRLHKLHKSDMNISDDIDIHLSFVDWLLIVG